MPINSLVTSVIHAATILKGISVYPTILTMLFRIDT